MICYECHQGGKTREAVALCQHCSAGLCSNHASILDDPVTTLYPVVKIVVLPLRARVFLCTTCRDALRQRSGDCSRHALHGWKISGRVQSGTIAVA